MTTDFSGLIRRYRDAGNALDIHVTASERLADHFGLPFMKHYLLWDLAKELRLGDAYEDVQAELTAALLDVDVIPFEDGYYKVDANGLPAFFVGSFCEAEIGVKP